MFRRLFLIVLIRRLFLIVLIAASVGSAHAAATHAPRLSGMGTYPLVTASRNPEAQQFFRQGMSLAWGFNPAEAARAFDTAASVDPRCALCWWGLAWALGPNINSDMAASDTARVHGALARASALSHAAGERNAALIAALARRHPAHGLDEEAYAAAMRRLAQRYPRDADLATLAAEAMLDLHPYDWWERDGAPKPWTPEIATLLARALKLDPQHPGANHYWIHLQEGSSHPAKALDAARRLESLVPGSGHLLHMPAHVYMRVGRYADASRANERSIAADARYLAEVEASGAYRVGYAAHNQHFLWASAAMEGRSAVAIAAARATYRAACGPGREDRSTGTLQHYYVLPLFALVRFGHWQEILTDTLPPDVAEPYPLAMWQYARGTAYARTGRLDDARRALSRLQALAASPGLQGVKIKNINPASRLVAIAVSTLQADIALAQGDDGGAVALLQSATAEEDALDYDEPHPWLAPTRQALGAALLATGRAREAEAAFRQDLVRYPENGWSLFGLAAALREQGRTSEADDAKRRHEAAWHAADFVLTKPRL